MKRHFEKHMTIDSKSRHHNITSKENLCYGSNNRVTYKREAQQLEAAQMRILTPLLGLPQDWTARETLTSETD
jgi:hypothetical protein